MSYDINPVVNVLLEPQLLHGMLVSDASASRRSFSRSSEEFVIAGCINVE